MKWCTSQPHDGGSRVHLQGKGRKLLAWLLVVVVNTLATWQVYHAQFSSSFDLFPGPRGDTRLIAYLVEHWYQVLSGHGSWLSPGMFYPIKGTLGYSDALLAYVVPYSILRAFGLDIFSALGASVIFLNYLNFIFCFILLNYVFRFNIIASCTGAMFFAFNNPRLAQPDHLQLQPMVFLLLTVIFIIIFTRNITNITQKKAFVLLSLAAIFLNLQLLTSFYIGWFFIFWCFLFFILSLLFQRTRLFILSMARKHLVVLLGSTCVFISGFLIFLRIYLPTVWTVGWFGILIQYIPEVKSYLLMADNNYIWGHLTAAILQKFSNGHALGPQISIGLIPSVAWIVISIFGIKIIKKNAKMTNTGSENIDVQDLKQLGYLFLGISILAVNLFYIITLQYRGHSLWNYVYLFFPGARSIRAVSRHIIFLSLPMAIVFAFAVQHTLRRISLQEMGIARVGLAAATLMLILFGLVEQFNSGDGQYYSISAENARLKTLAAKLPANCSSFYVALAPAAHAHQDPFQNQQRMHDAMLVSILRHVPTLNGRSGKSPPHWALRDVRAPDYEEHVRQWIERHKLGGNVCRLEIEA